MTDNMNEKLLDDSELDIIGEVINISMGAAATAISTMLDRQVKITTPRITQEKFKTVDCSDLEPSLMVKIKYVEGIEGVNVTLLKRSDIQLIIDVLMGNEISEPGDEDEFEFDEMSMSAASEIMNQMMGASATTMSEILEKTINISTPEPTLVTSKSDIDVSIAEIDQEDTVVSISFNFTVGDILNTRFIYFLSIPLARYIIETVNATMEDEDVNDVEEVVAAPQVETTPPPADAQPQVETAPPVTEAPQVPTASPPVQPQAVGQEPVQMPMQQPQAMGYPPMPQQYMQMPQQPYPNMYGQMPDPNMYQPALQAPAFPSFTPQASQMPSGSNMGLLMGVKLDVSVVIGRTKQKIKDIVEFGQGTVVELDRQTGSPAEIIVNGKLLAYGDVIVVGDNFGVRITEVVGTKELLDSLEN